MPSSPLVPPISPPPREFIDFGKNTRTRRTLEWACAAARVAEKDNSHSSSSPEMNFGSDTSSSSTLKPGGRNKGRTIRNNNKEQHCHNGAGSRREYEEGSAAMDVELTDDEDHEAITPPSTWSKGDLRWIPAEGGAGAGAGAGVMSNLPKGVDDDDMFKAALALCGLGRRT